MHAHLTCHELYPTLQSAYRKGHSTETALLKIHNDILMGMDRQHVVLVVLLGLNAAFDTVDHSVLLSHIKSYLFERSQHVSLDGTFSQTFPLK
jgi:hypothetical protein